MSGKAAKRKRKEEEAKKKDFEKRRDAMLAGIKKLSEENKIDVVAYLQVAQTGIVPMIAFMDVKDKYGHVTEEAKRAEAAKPNHETTNGKIRRKLKM